MKILVHRIPLLDVSALPGNGRRVSWVELMSAGGSWMGHWSPADRTLLLAQLQLACGLLDWATNLLKLSRHDVYKALAAGGTPWSDMVGRMASALDNAATALDDKNEAFMQMPASWPWPEATEWTGAEGLFAPFSVTPGNDSKAFHVRRERLGKICAGCAAQALVRLHTNSAARAQYWSRTNFAAGAIAWTSHLADASGAEPIVWNVVLNTPFDTHGPRTLPHPGWAMDAETAKPWVEVLALAKPGTSPSPLVLGLPLLPITRAARLGEFSAGEEDCDMCHAHTRVVSKFALMTEPQVLSQMLGRPLIKKKKKGKRAEVESEAAAQPAPDRAAGLFSKMLAETTSRHPWSVLLERKSSRTAMAKGAAETYHAPQSLSGELGLRKEPEWLYFKAVVAFLPHLHDDQATPVPKSIAFAADMAKLIALPGRRLHVMMRAFATRPVGPSNPNLASTLDTEFGMSLSGHSLAVDTALAAACDASMQKIANIVRARRDAWQDMARIVNLDSRQPAKGGQTATPLKTIVSKGVAASMERRRAANRRAEADPDLASCVASAWDEAGYMLSEYLSSGQPVDTGKLSEALDEMTSKLLLAWRSRSRDTRDWARIANAYAAYRAGPTRKRKGKRGSVKDHEKQPTEAVA